MDDDIYLLISHICTCSLVPYNIPMPVNLCTISVSTYINLSQFSFVVTIFFFFYHFIELVT